jgi:hypothetical protein
MEMVQHWFGNLQVNGECLTEDFMKTHDLDFYYQALQFSSFFLRKQISNKFQ